MTDVDPRAVELALQQVAGVASATVEPGPGGGTLRLVLEPGADADAVGALVRRRLADRFGLGVDPAAGLPGESGGVPPAPPRDAVDHPALPEAPGSPATVDPGVRGDAPRLAVLPGGRPASPSVAPAFAPAATRFRMVAGERDAARIEVSVGAGPREATGAAEAPATIDGLRRAAAEATARAVAGLRGDLVSPQVEDVWLDADGSARTARVRITGGTAGDGPRTGSAEVGDDVRLAVVRAVLDATSAEPSPSWWTRLYPSDRAWP